MRLKKSKIRKYEGGGFASATGIGMEMPSPVQEIELEEKDKAKRFSNVATTTTKGAALGASVGSAIPGVGTAVGAVVGGVAGAAVGLITNRKEEKKRQELNKEREAANEEMKQANLSNWRKYANAEDTYNIQRAQDTGYDVMGNTNAQFYKTGGRLSKVYAFRDGGLSRSEDFGSSDKPYPSVNSGDFAGGHRSYPIPTKADAIDALRLAGLHGRSDVVAKVHAKYPGLGKDKYPDGGKIETKKDVVLPKAFETPIPKDLPLVKPEVKKPQAPKAPEKTYSTVKIGDKTVNLSRNEHEYLKQFGDNVGSRNAALWEMMGVDDSKNTYHAGSESFNKKEEFKNKAIDLYNEGYKADRSTQAPTTYAAYSAANTNSAIDNKTTLNTKTEKYLGKTSSDLSEAAVNNAAQKSVTEGGGTYTGSDFNPADSQKLVGEPGYVAPTTTEETVPVMRNGGNLYLKGGRLSQLSDNTYQAEGNTHEQGGIRLTPNAEIEGKETVTDNGNSLFVASANLRNPATGNTFAKDDASISKKIGKFENRNDKASQNALKMLETKKSNLQMIQQSMNGDKTGTTMRNGGRLSINKYPDGSMLYKTQVANPSTGLDTAGGGGPSLDMGGYQGGVDMQTGAAKTMSSTGTITPSFKGGGGGGGGGAMAGALPGMINKVGQAVTNYGTSFLEYANQKKQIKKLEALKIPDPILQSYQNLGRQSMDVDKANINRDVAAANVGADRGLTDSNVAAAVKAANLSKGLQAKAEVNQAERNVNQQIANQESQVNQQTQAGNNAMLMAKQQAEFQKKADIINMKGEAFSKLMENIRTGQNTARQERHVNTQYGLDAYKLNDEQRAGLNKYMQQNNNTLYGGKKFAKGGRLSKMYC